MTDQPPTISDDDLHAFVDGALDPERRRSVKAALSQDPDAAARVAAYRSQAEALHTAYDPVGDAPLPEGLRRVAQAPAPRPAPAVWSLRAAAAAALLILGGAAGWLLNDAGNPSANYFAELTGVASEAHRIYAAEVRHPVEVAAEEQAHLFAWLSNRLGSAVWAPNLSDQGYSLVGGRLLPSGDGPAAQFMYETEAGERLTLFVRSGADQGETAFRFARNGDEGAFYWVDRNFGYALVGTIEREPLLRAARAVFVAFSE